MDEQRLTELRTMPYEDYLQTPEWAERRAFAIQRAGNRCQICNSADDLNAHHRTYERRGNEEPGDLTVLCQSCHAWFHYRMTEHESLHHITVAVSEAMGKIEKPEIYRVPTGFGDLDRLIGQLQKGQLIVVGSRTEQGGLPFLHTIGLNAAMAKKSVAFFSTTMNKERLAEQLMGIDAGIDTLTMQTRKFVDTHWERLIHAMGTLQEMSFWIGDSVATVEDIERQVVECLIENNAIDVVMIDSIELLENGKKEFPDQRIASISRMLKLLARKLNIPIVVLCQIPHAVQSRAEKVPQITDVKTTEPFADIVLLLYFDQVYNPESERKHILDVHIAKNGNGPVGEVSLFYADSHSRIRDLEAKKPEEGK